MSAERRRDELARLLETRAAAHRDHFPAANWWNDRLLEWSVSHPSFKAQLFRFVDVFPVLVTQTEVLDHLEQYLVGTEAPHGVDLGVQLASHLPFGASASAGVVRSAVNRMARQFIAGSDPEHAVQALRAEWDAGVGFTVDALGEKTVSGIDAGRYAGRVGELLDVLARESASWQPQPILERDDLGPLARVNISVKPTGLSPYLAPLTREQGIAEAIERLEPILLHARDARAHVHFDMEHYDVKEVSLGLFDRILADERFSSVSLGIVVQAYLKDSLADLERLIAISARRPLPLTVRLVKGAYWDTESMRADAEGWPRPVFSRKDETDDNFTRCARVLHDHHGEVRAAFGTHNVSSLAFVIDYARELGIPDGGYEIQMLYGMASPFHDALRELGARVRIYAPVGELVPGMAYLVRRLLENSANESITSASVRRTSGRHLERDRTIPSDLSTRTDVTVEPAVSTTSFRPEPLARWHLQAVRDEIAREVEAAAGRGVIDVPGMIEGRMISTATSIDSVDPSRSDRVVARSANCGTAEADEAIAAATRAGEVWSKVPVTERAEIVFRAAAWMRERRGALVALEVVEAGKPWAEGDADVCEAIDFCEYYAREMLRLSVGGVVQSPPGEHNALHYAPRGIAVVIAPWNFPLAIPTGMVIAALVTGNTVIFKPAEQTPAIAQQLAMALYESGLPRGVLSFLPGVGEVVGSHLVSDPSVALVAFTGSKSVGLGIIESAAVHRIGQRSVKRVIAEMGGKNAIIIDADADLDQAIPIVLTSTFGYSGQKCSACSRLIVVGSIYDELIGRLVDATRELRIGTPLEMGTQLGPLIDATAVERVRAYQAGASSYGRVVLEPGDVPSGGYFVAPSIVTEVDPSSALAKEEIFGPVLAVMRVDSIDEALALANDSEYALTAGIVSRSPRNIERMAEEIRAGNLYVNRPITHAVVGRHPFGGYGLSGVGSKAGGPDYLLQFLEPRSRSENTIRQGFAPDTTYSRTRMENGVTL